MHQLATNHFVLSAEQFIHSKPVADEKRIIARILANVNERKPCSLIRLNDGEGRILGYGYSHGRDSVDFILETWFGPQGRKLIDEDVFRIQNELARSIRTSDIIGLPRTFAQRKNALGCAAAVFAVPLEKWHRISKGSDLLGEAAIHQRLEHVDLVAQLAQSKVNKILTISCHDVRGYLADRFPALPLAENILIPGEQRYVKSQGSHFPDRFEEVREALREAVKPGDVCLIGGGVLGKIYAGIARDMGGVAIDIGSIFDLWAGVPSRGFIKRAFRKSGREGVIGE